jgi:muconate cycloisomerase
MRIDRAEVFWVQLPTRRLHTWVGSYTPLGGFVILKLYADDGTVGLGESPMLIEWGGEFGRYGGESPKTAMHVIMDYLVPAVAGLDPCELSTIHARMDTMVKGHVYAKTAIDIACFDLAGKALGVPAHALLGGCFRSEIPVAHTFGMNLSADEVQPEAEAALDEGIRTLKLKVGHDTDRDVAVVERLRRTAGDGVDITVDANMGWPDAKTAAKAIARLDEFDVAFVEQPVEGVERMAEVRRLVRPRVMADEGAWSARDVYDLARHEAADIVSIYTTKPGGLHNAMKVAAVCEATGIHANVNGTGETGVGNAANLHLAAAAKMIDEACVVSVSAPEGRRPTRMAGLFYTDDLVVEPYGYRDGNVLVPTGPGLGVELDEDKLERYRVVGADG